MAERERSGGLTTPSPPRRPEGTPARSSLSQRLAVRAGAPSGAGAGVNGGATDEKGWGFESLRLCPGQKPVPIMERAFGDNGDDNVRLRHVSKSHCPPACTAAT